MKKNKIIKKTLLGIGILSGALFPIICACNLLVDYNASGRTYNSIDSIPHNRVGIILANSPITPSEEHNFYFDNRIKAAIELHKAGKIDVIIASGGDYSLSQKNGFDEPWAIRDSLMKHRIHPWCIELDYEGTRTLNSIAKLKEIYNVDSVTIISQKYHNERAIYLADKYGLHAIGYNAAPTPIKRNRIKNALREFLARPKMVLDILLGVKPKIKNQEIELPDSYYDGVGLPKYLNSVRGHKEEFFIVGNFTGESVDTLYYDCDFGDCPELINLGEWSYYDRAANTKYFLRSNNPMIPSIELFNPNLLVFEGDVDGDGRDEWGYIHSWMCSQWRQYRIYNYDPKTKKWRHLYYGHLLNTPEYIRASGVDLVEKGPKPGLIKINWLANDCVIRTDTVKPTYTPISEDAW